MRTFIRSGNTRKNKETMRLILTGFLGVVFGFILGVSFPTLTLTKLNIPSTLFPSIEFSYVEGKYSSLSTQEILKAWFALNGKTNAANEMLHFNESKIWVPANPRGAERLPPGIVESESDFYLRRLWGHPGKDLVIKPKYLVTFTVGYDQMENIDAAVKKFSENFTIMLFHYDGRTSEWNKFEWSKRAIHVSAPKQTKCEEEDVYLFPRACHVTLIMAK